MRIKISNREAATYIKLRRDFGYTINQIASAFGRSTNVVWRRLQRNIDLGVFRRIDLRKIPNAIRKKVKYFNIMKLQQYILGWEKWISTGKGKPP